MIINWIFIGSIRKEWLMLMRLSPSFVCLVCVCVPSQRALFGRPGAAPVPDWCEKRLFKAIFTCKRSIYQARLATNMYTEKLRKKRPMRCSQARSARCCSGC
eukprot:COSAG01_NODE_1827_length_9125_cov_2.863314_5_plen_102_part_00